MYKNIMKKLLLSLVAAILAFISCDKFDDSLIWDKLNDHESRIQALEAWCQQTNTNITSLKAALEALEKNDYVTNVVALTEGGKIIGYTLTFAKSGNITIYHGQDGKDGDPGQDGHTPVIGVRQDADGVYYWTLDGEWLIDADGNKIPVTGQDGAQGAPGQNGSDGKDGQNGITPQLKIEDDYWYVSYDNGLTWVRLNKAVSEDGQDGEDGKDSVNEDSFFKSVDTSSAEYIIITLADGTQIKFPTWKAFEDLQSVVSRLNTNLASLQAIVEALQNNDYITDVTPIYNGAEEIGYIITFSKGGKITIYHGQDGKDGQDGAPGQDGINGNDGATPVIGVAMDTDCIYYWTVNGAWLLDANGNKVKAVGTDGKDGEASSGSAGAAGAPGKDGKDGVTPQLKIENGLWYVSYDNGSTWTELGQATGDQGPQGATGAQGTTGPQGPQGSAGKDGDSFFQNVDTSDPDYVVVTLADGTQFKIPTWKAFEALQTLVTQINTNVESLQTIVNALQNKDYVTSITPITENGATIGYTIHFSQSGSVNIYHGTDGVDGETPVIGVSKDSDGIYYWTVNGAWLLDANGKKIKAAGSDGKDGVAGSNGQNGATGAAGKDGVTPQLKIEDGRWYVSYDNGLTWTDLGQATGDQGPQGGQGPQGTPGQNGDAFFQSVTQDQNNVYLTLADGTVITIPRHPAEAVTMALGTITTNSALFNGTVNRNSPDLKVTLYYSLNSDLTVYKNAGHKSITDFGSGNFSLMLSSLNSNTTYYYFIETVSNGVNSYTKTASFKTGAEEDEEGTDMNPESGNM